MCVLDLLTHEAPASWHNIGVAGAKGGSATVRREAVAKGMEIVVLSGDCVE